MTFTVGTSTNGAYTALVDNVPVYTGNDAAPGMFVVALSAGLHVVTIRTASGTSMSPPNLAATLGGFLRLDDEPPWTAQVQTVSWSPVVLGDDEVSFPLLFQIMELQEPATVQVQDTSWTPVVITDDEAKSGMFLDPEDAWTAQAQAVDWNPVTIADTDVAPATGGLDTDQDWTRTVQQVTWSPVTVSDDEIGPVLKHFTLEQQEPATVQTQAAELVPVRRQRR